MIQWPRVQRSSVALLFRFGSIGFRRCFFRWFFLFWSHWTGWFSWTLAALVVRNVFQCSFNMFSTAFPRWFFTFVTFRFHTHAELLLDLTLKRKETQAERGIRVILIRHNHRILHAVIYMMYRRPWALHPRFSLLSLSLSLSSSLVGRDEMIRELKRKQRK